MKKIFTLLLFFILSALITSCGTLPPPTSKKPYRPMSSKQKSAVIGSVDVIFQTRQVPGYREDNRNISNMAYIELLKKAKELYDDYVDVFDITWTDMGSVRDESDKWAGYKFAASGKVITQKKEDELVGIEDALIRAANDAMKNVSKNTVIAIIYITAQEGGIINYINNELEFILVKNGYIIVDRSHLNILRQEQNFQLSGEVDDTAAISIGKMLGANAIITGILEGSGNLRRLRLRVLNVETGQIIGAASERL